MNLRTERRVVVGPAGDLVCALDTPSHGPSKGLAVVCHPHPLHGGTLDNKVVATLARAFVQTGWRSARFNFRGVGGSAGTWDEGRGEIDDALAVIAALRADAHEPLALAGFSFGAYVASHAARVHVPRQLVLVGPATQNFTVAPVPPGTLVIHGESDEVVPLADTLDWARPQTLPVVVVPGAGHFFHGLLPLLKSLVVHHLCAATP
ncbi:MAG TPA: alpha/beta fold hydrolase [Burkholderiaceae bacterium]|nr:alpha/beta fold hydrolase [Burkholderiaceae bacterium]